MFDEIEKLALLASITEDTCGLSHGPDPGETGRVVDYICQGLGVVESDVVSTIQDRIVIPVCKDCADAIAGDVWVLLYCLGCNRSQWVIKELAKYKYQHNIVWMAECHECKKC